MRGLDCCGPRKIKRKKKKRAGGPSEEREERKREVREKERVEWGNKIGKNKLKINKNIRRVLL